MLHIKVEQQSAALGAFFGACVGDAAGAPLEFIGRKPSISEVKQAMTMPGGGCWKVAPGQCTDDGELALCLARSIVANKKFDSDLVAQGYRQWYASKPFDIGETIYSAFSSRSYLDGDVGTAQNMRIDAKNYSMKSKANGSLMRCIPLAILGWSASGQQLAELASLDSTLSHPNPTCCSAVGCYIQSVASLISYPGDSKRAFNRALSWARKYAEPEVVEWLISAANGRLVAGYPQAGFIKIAFIHAYHHLLAKSTFEDALENTLKLGGDTDTNACIVCGLVGARVGIVGIPPLMLQKVNNCQTNKGRERPEWLHPRQIQELVPQLLEYGVGITAPEQV